ncbi:hypothetical protein BGZ65_009586, partial [Modicella reniformis]
MIVHGRLLENKSQDMDSSTSSNQDRPKGATRSSVQGQAFQTGNRDSLLEGSSLPLDLPTDQPRLPHRSLEEANWPIRLGTKITQDLKNLARNRGIDLQVILLSAWAIILSRLTGQDHFPIALRSYHSSHQTTFVVDLSGDPDVLQVLERITRTALTSGALEQVSQSKQCQATFSWCGHDQELGIRDWNLSPPDSALAPESELELCLQDAGAQIVGAMRYSAALFGSTTIERHVAYLGMALEQVASNTTQLAANTDILPPSERELVLQTWNTTQANFPSDLCLHHLFENQVAHTPDAVAVVHEDKTLSYAELNSRANSLAHNLLRLGVQPDMPVAISTERSLGMIIGILAILKAGGAYVPLDPSYTGGRLREILDDVAPTILVADKAGKSAIGEAIMSSLVVVDPNTVKYEDHINPQLTQLTSRHLAYVIYTSGSTGKPKGVMMEHQGAVNVFCSRPELFAITTTSRFLQFASFGFSHSVSEIFSPLTAGATLYLVPNDSRLDRYQLWDYLTTHAITHVSFTASLLQTFKDMPPLKSLQVLVVMGEASSPTLPEILRTVAPNSTIINHYGSTEAFSGLVWKPPKDFGEGAMPIGRPIPNKRVYVLDARDNPVPLGSVGEMHIGGVGVARGYLNKPEWTADKFITDPFSGDADARMYKTGDLVRYLPDGNIVYLGRNDHQVKIRGFRVELGEIEARLEDHPLVRETVVVALGDDAGKRIVAYVTYRDDPQWTQVDSAGSQLASILRSHLVTALPDYMIPAAFMRLEAFPLNANGKLDRRALPAPDDEAFAREAYEEPQGEIEQTLASIWSELLKVENVSRRDNFFALGGHSLLAIQMISRLKHLGYSLSVRSLFDTPTLSVLAESIGEHHEIVIPPNAITPDTTRITPSQLPLVDLTQPEIDRIVERLPGGVSNIQDIYALSPLQDGILFHHLIAKSGDPYVVHVYMAFESKVLLDRYLAAIQEIVNCHDILRTSFVWQGLSTPVQVVWRQASLSITELQIEQTKGPVVQQLKQILDHRTHRMDLTQAPLLRFVTAQDGDGRWILVRLQHHLISDRSTSERMKVEIQEFLEGRGNALPPPVPYRDHIAQIRLGTNQNDHEKFFKEMLADIDNPTLPYDLLDTHGDGAVFTSSRRMLPSDLNIRLRSQAKRLSVGLTSLCHLAWALVVARTSGQQRVVFGTVLLGRMQATANSARAMGLFINTLPIRVDFDERGVEDSVRATHKFLAALLEYEHASLALAQRSSGVPAGTPLFSSLLNYTHSSMPSESAPNHSGMELLDFLDRTNYPVGLSVEDFGDALAVTAQTMRPIDPSKISAYMEQALESIASALEHAPRTPAHRLEVLPMEERTLLLHKWNQTQEHYPDSLCLHHLFEQQVERTPNAIALVFEDQSLTYSELNARANGLAHHLIDLGVQPDDLVAICVERSPEMIIGLLAILKSGGAYVPLDPSHASQRLRDILCDAAPVCLVADGSGLAAIGDTLAKATTLVDLSSIDIPQIPSNPQNPHLTPNHLVYIVYTSGTTGKPKGVMIEHQGVVSLVTYKRSFLSLGPGTRQTQFFSFSFDASVYEIFLSICNGGTLHLLSETERFDRQQLWNYLETHSITNTTLPPAFLQDCKDLTPLTTPTTFVLVGEALTTSLVHTLNRLVPDCAVINGYGPTEVTVGATAWRVQIEEVLDKVPIGRPFANKRLYILDTHGNPVPLGVVGELFIGGVGVARGYLNRPDLTAERFVPDPFAVEPDARMYKTGDLARYLPDGNLVYFGRNDDQVKIRGFRIELGEVEARLYDHPSVAEAVVVAIGHESNKRLVAYVVTQRDEQPEDNMNGDYTQLAMTLRSHLVQCLPEYMVPSAFVHMDAFPLNANGKLDRRALPEPGAEAFAREAYEKPQGEIEQALASLWSELLNVECVSRRDSFFALGGHSLLAVRMTNRINALGINLSLAILFNSPSLVAFAKECKKALEQESISLPAIDHIPRGDLLPLSFAQQRLWFLSQFDGVSDTYHIPLAIRLRGRLVLNALRGAFDSLIARHEALRSVFVSVDGQPHVQILPAE